MRAGIVDPVAKVSVHSQIPSIAANADSYQAPSPSTTNPLATPNPALQTYSSAGAAPEQPPPCPLCGKSNLADHTHTNVSA